VELILLAALVVAAALAPRWAASDPAHPSFAVALERSGLPVLLAALLALTALAMAWVLGTGKPARWLAVPNVAGFLAILALVVAPLAPLLDRERLQPIRQLARQARALARADEPLWVVGTKRYSTLFYGGETASFISSKEGLQERLREDPKALGLTPSSRSARMLGDRRQLEALEWSPAAVRRLARIGEQELWRVRLPLPNDGGQAL
jgi:hypothetical protein